MDSSDRRGKSATHRPVYVTALGRGRVRVLNPPAAAEVAVKLARKEALAKHGPLKLKPTEPYRHLAKLLYEEADEACYELDRIESAGDDRINTVERAINELAQLAQLAMGMIELLTPELNITKEKVKWPDSAR